MTRKMRHLVKREYGKVIEEAILFYEDELALKDFLDDDYQIVGVFEIKLLEGEDILPSIAQVL